MTSLTCDDAGRRRLPRPLFGRVLDALRDLHGRWTVWRERRDRRDAFAVLLAHDDRMLADIGLLRDDIDWALRQPLVVDAARAARERAIGRRAGEGRGRARRRHGARHLDAVYQDELRRLGVPR